MDFNQWPEFSKCIVLLLMFIGACAGSTGGGIKVSRIMMAFKEAKKEMAAVIHPRSVKVIKYEGKVLGHPVLRSLNAYLILYALIFAVSVLLVSLDNFDFATRDVYKRQAVLVVVVGAERSNQLFLKIFSKGGVCGVRRSRTI